MAELKGLYGLSIQTQQIGSPIRGFFGISIQIGTNFSMRLRLENGVTIANATVSFTYTQGGVITKEVFAYDPNTLYQRMFPQNSAINIAVAGQGLTPFAQDFTINTGAYLNAELILKAGYVQLRRFYR